MVYLSRIYTKTGDDGRTALFGGGRVQKDDLRVEAYGDVDELNAVIGAALGDDRLVIRSLDNASITVVEVVGTEVRLVSGGREADTLIR